MQTRRSSVGLADSSSAGLGGVSDGAGGVKAGNFSTRFSLPSFVKQVRRLTEEQRTALKNMGFGNLLLIPNQTLSKNLLVELLDRWSIDNHSFLLPPGDAHITLMDVALILGLRVVGIPVLLKDDQPFTDLERDYGAVLSKRKITIASLETKLASLSGICDDDFMRTFLLYTFGTILFPNANGTVDSRYLSFLQNSDNICQFTWGAAVLQDLLYWLDKRKETNVKYVGGCLIFLQIWSYEHFDIARPGLLDTYRAYPRVCRWDSSRSHNRQRCASMLNDLQEQQVIWELQPTSIELEVDIVNELLQASQGKRHAKSIRELPIANVFEVEIESERSFINEVPYEDEANLENLVEFHKFEVLTNSIDYPSMSCSMPNIHEEWNKVVSTMDGSSRVVIVDNVNDLTRTAHMLKEQNMELKKEIEILRRDNVQLRGENERLRNQQSPSLQLEEQNAQLMKEVDEWRRENHVLSLSTNNFVVQLEKLLLDEDINGYDESSPALNPN